MVVSWRFMDYFYMVHVVIVGVVMKRNDMGLFLTIIFTCFVVIWMPNGIARTQARNALSKGKNDE